ncbi:PucR family transcriptional regulator [Nocardioides ferulae]|uniref:PucR family transcriptional regulator n=1 Tax=Nocardioides ferulae TaxID=2340821 RepID=UPI0013DE128C|nr:PucR family transcriptional regulator [Nocardioides ferulae]
MTGLTVARLLALPVMQAARPEVVVGSGLDRRSVRWIHTSEIYDISPLLKGGEVLLTTGLGLVGMGSTAVGGYVASLARQQVAALMLELGRTFTRPPEGLVEAAAEHDLPLVLLRGVVPFIEVTEAVHPMLVEGEVARLRRLEEASSRLSAVLATGAGIAELLTVVEDLCGVEAGVYSPGGALLVGRDVRTSAPSTTEHDVGGGPWAVLALAGEATPSVRAVAQRCATSLAVCLAQSGPAGGGRRPAGAELVRWLTTGQYLSRGEIIAQAEAAGLGVRRGHQVVGVALALSLPTPTRAGLNATAAAARAVLGPALVAEVDGVVMLAGAVPPGQLRARLQELVRSVDEELRATVGGSVARAVGGPPVEDVAGLARCLPAAREALTLANRLVLGSRVVLASELGVYMLLSRVVTDADLEGFVEDQLGPLLEQDARRGSDLVTTLDTYLEVGLSKTAAAEALGIRRQTLYSRLERISRLLGDLDFDARQARTALDLALVSWRLRSSAANRPG